jgi:hypothetical protein
MTMIAGERKAAEKSIAAARAQAVATAAAV